MLSSDDTTAKQDLIDNSEEISELKGCVFFIDSLCNTTSEKHMYEKEGFALISKVMHKVIHSVSEQKHIAS